MVHVKKCPRKKGRGKPTTEFYKDGKPQIYCYGWRDLYNDEPLECCRNCDDWVYGEQCERDFQEMLEKRSESEDEIMILCPKCGKVKEYGIKEYVHRIGIFNENNECVETTEDVGFRYGQPRCLKCNSIVRFYVEPQESEK